MQNSKLKLQESLTAALELLYEAAEDNGYDLHIYDKDGEYPLGMSRDEWREKQKNAAFAFANERLTQ